MKLLFWLGIAAFLWWVWKGNRLGSPQMTKDEAAKLLGLSPDANAEAVISAHKRLIAKVHPDSGGSAELASQINRARDTLLK